MKKILLSALLSSVLALFSEASDEMLTHTELGFIDTQGNTRTQTFNLDAKATKGIEKHMLSLTFDAQYAISEEIETKNKFTGELDYSYAFSEKFSFEYLAGFKQDRFSGYVYQFYTGPGVKYKALSTQSQSIDLGADVLYSQDSIEGVDESEKYGAYRIKGVYAWKINDKSKLTQELNYRSDFDNDQNYFVYSKTALSTKVSDILSAGLSYKADYSNIPASAKEYTDKTLSVNLIIDY